MKDQVNIPPKKCSRVGAALTLKCPNCCNAPLFINQNPYNFKTMGKMPDECPNCGQDFVIEPGFYFGAAMISYVIQVFMIGICAAVVYLVGGREPLQYIISISLVILVTAPYVMVVSRGLWLSIFVKKEGEPD
ncbi:MAG: DUF983 domain-containing protein [Bacteroidia bacterium]|nr:DUF983 domain-containing protein [Bacteroidia bacterium]